jgi:hypothetical protein
MSMSEAWHFGRGVRESRKGVEGLIILGCLGEFSSSTLAPRSKLAHFLFLLRFNLGSIHTTRTSFLASLII